MGRQQLLYKYPPDLQKAQKHRLAKRIFKGVQKDPSCQECECCDRKIGAEIVESSCCYDKNDLAFLGPGIPLLFAYIRNCVLLLLTLTLVFAGFCFYSNFSSQYCNQSSTDCQYNIFNTISFANKMDESDLLSIQNYILLAFVVANIFLFQFFRYNFRTIQEECDDIVNSPSDYAIILRRLPENTTKEHIQKMIDGRRAQLTEQEKRQTQNLKIDHIVLSYAMSQFTKVKQKNKENFKKLIDQGKHTQFTPQPFPKLTETAKLAIVVFSRQQSKQYFLYKPSIPQKLLQLFCDPCTPLSNFVVNGQRVSIERAPQPDDVVWQNSKISISGGIIRKSIFNFLGFLVLCIGGAAQYGLALLQNTVTDPTQKQIYSIGLSILVSIFNFIILQFLIFSSHRERNETLTEFNTVLTVKISLFQFLNTGIFVVLANFLADMGSFSITEGLPTDVTIVMLMNAISPNVTLWALNYFEIVGKVYRWLVRTEKIKVTQLEANQIWQGPPPQIPYKYAYVLKTIWLTAFYAPLVPVVVPISMVGLTLNYFIEKHLYRYVYSVPNMLSSMVNDSAVELMEYFPLIISLGEFIIYCYMKNFAVVTLPENWSIPIYISLGLSFLNLALPMDELNKCIKLKIDNQENPPYQKVQEKFEVTYEMTNPAYECKKKRKRDVFLFNQIFGGQGKNVALNLSDLIGVDQTNRSMVRDPLLNKNTQGNQNENVLINMAEQNGEIANMSKMKQGDTTMNTTQDNLNKSLQEENPFAAFLKLNVNNSFDNGQKPQTPKQTSSIQVGSNNLNPSSKELPAHQGTPNTNLKTNQNVLPGDLLQDPNKNNQKITKTEQKGQVRNVSPSDSSASYKNLTKDLNFKYNNSSSSIPTNMNQVPGIPIQTRNNEDSQAQKNLAINSSSHQDVSQNPNLQLRNNPQTGQINTTVMNLNESRSPQSHIAQQNANVLSSQQNSQINVQPSNPLNLTINQNQPSHQIPQLKQQTTLKEHNKNFDNIETQPQPQNSAQTQVHNPHQPQKIIQNQPQTSTQAPAQNQTSIQKIQPQTKQQQSSQVSYQPQMIPLNQPTNQQKLQQTPVQTTSHSQKTIQTQPQNAQLTQVQNYDEPQKNTHDHPQHSAQSSLQISYQPKNINQNQTQISQQTPQFQNLNSQKVSESINNQPQKVIQTSLNHPSSQNQPLNSQPTPQIQAQSNKQIPTLITKQSQNTLQAPQAPHKNYQQVSVPTSYKQQNPQQVSSIQAQHHPQFPVAMVNSQQKTTGNQPQNILQKPMESQYQPQKIPAGQMKQTVITQHQETPWQESQMKITTENERLNNFAYTGTNKNNNEQKEKQPSIQNPSGGQYLFNSLVQIKNNVQNSPTNVNIQNKQIYGLPNVNMSNSPEDPPQTILFGKKELSNLPYKYPNQVQPNIHTQNMTSNPKISDLQQVSQPQIDNYLLNQHQNQATQPQLHKNQPQKQCEVKIPLLSLAARLQSMALANGDAKKVIEKPPTPKNKTFAQAFPHYMKQKQVQKQARNKFIEEGVKQLQYENKKFTKSGVIFFQSPKSTQNSSFPHVQIHVPGLKPNNQSDEFIKTSQNRRSFGRSQTDKKQLRRNQDIQKEDHRESTPNEKYNPRFMQKR